MLADNSYIVLNVNACVTLTLKNIKHMNFAVPCHSKAWVLKKINFLIIFNLLLLLL
jgi:hypothetical protein